MNKVLKKMTLKALSPYAIAAVILAVIFLGLSCQGLVTMAVGPTDLSEANLDNGEYVSFDASEVIVAFASLSVSNDSGTQVLETYYLLPAGDGTYLAVMDAEENNVNVLDRAMEQSHEYYLGDLETLTRLGDLQGTVSTLDEDMTSYMVDCITNYSLPGYDADSILALIQPLQINVDKVGFLYADMATVFAIVGAAFLLIFLAILVPALMGAYQKKALAVVTENKSAEEAEEAFQAALKIERVHAGEFIWYPKGPGTRVLKAKDIVWGYSMPEPLVVSKYRWPVALYDTEQKFTQIAFLEKKNREVFLSAIATQGHPFVEGYTSDLSQQFKSDFDGFMKKASEAARGRKVQ